MLQNKKKGVNKFLAEIGWRELIILINNFHMFKGNYSIKFDNFGKKKKVFNCLEKQFDGLSNRRRRYERTLFHWLMQ